MQSSRPYARTAAAAAGQVAHARPRTPSHEPTAGQVAGRGDETVTWVILSGLFARKGSLSEALSERLCRMARTALTDYSFCHPGLPVRSRHFVVADVVATGINREGNFLREASGAYGDLDQAGLDGRIARWARLGRLGGCA